VLSSLLLETTEEPGETKTPLPEMKDISELLGDIDTNPAPYPKPDSVDDSKFKEKFNKVNNNGEDSCVVS
jgi:hypothetical protein